MVALAILLAGSASFAQKKPAPAKTHQHATASKKYSCTMHPEVVSNKPGKCPKCGMKMVAMKTKKTAKKMGDMKM